MTNPDIVLIRRHPQRPLRSNTRFPNLDTRIMDGQAHCFHRSGLAWTVDAAEGQSIDETRRKHHVETTSICIPDRLPVVRLIPAHAADVPGHPDMGDMPVWEETEPSESTPMPEAEAGPEQSPPPENVDTAGVSTPAQQENNFEIRSESDLKAAISSINSGAPGIYTISLLENIQVAGSEQGALKIKQNTAILLGNGHALTYAPNADSRWAAWVRRPKGRWYWGETTAQIG